MRQLDKFQQFVKDKDIQPNKTNQEAQDFLNSLNGELDGTYEYIKDELCGYLDVGDFIDAYSVYESIEDVMDSIARNKVNELIQTTREQIEDIEAVNDMEPEDPMDAHKRAEELKQ